MNGEDGLGDLVADSGGAWARLDGASWRFAEIREETMARGE